MENAFADRLRNVFDRLEARVRRESDEANADLALCRGADDSALQAWIADRSQPSIRRRNALIALAERWRVERSLTDVVLPLFDDPDDALAEQAVNVTPPFDPRGIEALRRLMDDPRTPRWTSATMALARRKDRSVVPKLIGWFRSGDSAHRTVAFSALAYVLTPEERRIFVESAWEVGPRDEEDAAMIEAVLREMGDPT